MKIAYCSVPTVFLFAILLTTNIASAATPPVSEVTYYNPITIEARVREYFKEAPRMIEIARCESKFRQYTDSGNPLRGPGGMVGVFQFYESIHAPGALALGFDITTLEGNLGYAKHVYNTQGLTPWNSSRWCWDVPTVAPAPAATLATPITPAPALSAHTVTNRAALQEQILTLTKLIALLQKQLALKSVTSLS